MKSLSALENRGLLLGILVLALFSWTAAAAAREIKEATINFVEVEKDEAATANRVMAYVTVSAPDESPVRGLAAADFSVLEDGREIVVQEAAPATDPMSVILALDTSGSMLAQDRRTGQTSMAAAREAAVSFVDMLVEKDRVAVYSFNNAPELSTDFSDPRATVREALAAVRAKPDAATCLWDTAYEAVKKAAEVPRGRRAIILLTDGRDEKGKAACSTYTASDVIDAATTQSIRVPIFTIGLGPRVDARQLSRMASLTGGRSLMAPSAADLTRFYRMLADQLKHQYRIAYSTRSPSGEHSLVVKVRSAGGSLQDEKRFWSPPLPVLPQAKIAFLAPSSSAPLKGAVTVRIRIEPDRHIKQVRYYVDGSLKHEIQRPPFDTYTWKTQDVSGGLHVLRVEAVDTGGRTVAQERTVTVAATPGSVAAAGETVPASAGSGMAVWIIGALAALCLAAAAAFFWMWGRREGGPAAAVDSGSATAAATMPDFEDETVFLEDADEAPGEREAVPQATLTVIQSMVLSPGKTFDVGPRTTVGRTDRNDVDIPDKPVSRKHAEIYFHEGRFRIRDLGSRNGIKLDGKRVYMDGAPLTDGAQIKFGPQTVLRFNCMPPAPIAPSTAEEPEAAPDDDSTQLNFESDKTLRYEE